MLVVTSNDIPGYQVRAVFGEVFGVTVRARNVGAGFTAGLRSIGGGEIPEMTQLLLQSRNEAMGRMIYQAPVRGDGPGRPDAAPVPVRDQRERVRPAPEPLVTN